MTTYLHWLGSGRWLPVTKSTFEIDIRVSNSHNHPMYHLVKTEQLGIHVFTPKKRWYRWEDNMWHQKN
jgi:hypothetical protein